VKLKKFLKRWPLLVTVILSALTLVLAPATAALAAEPPLPSDPALGIDTTLKIPSGGPSGGSLGTYIDILLNQDDAVGPLPGWCADEYHTISVGSWYNCTVFDYFGYDYPSHLDYLEDYPAVAAIPWGSIAWILNNSSAYTMPEIQQAMWIVLYWTPTNTNDSNYNGLRVHFGINNATANAHAQALANAALANSTFVPDRLAGQVRPVICFNFIPYNTSLVQIVFFSYGGGTPPPPLPEWPAGVLAGMGLAGLAAFVIIRKVRKPAAAKLS
jgi:hypothetical protein